MKSQLTLMIVDDDDDDRMLFKEAVKETDRNFLCVEATHGEAALKILDNPGEKLPDIIFLDLNMPGISGKQCLKRIKDNKKWKDIPVVIYSTSKRAEDFYETHRMGALSFVIKPSSFDEICKMISETLVEVQHIKNHPHNAEEIR